MFFQNSIYLSKNLLVHNKTFLLFAIKQMKSQFFSLSNVLNEIDKL